MSIIRISHLTKNYGTGEAIVNALTNVTLSLEKEEFVSIMGPSGSGKSTFLYLIGGLDVPTSGEILINGKNLARLSDGELSRFRRDEVGFVFQFYNLIPTLTVEQNIALPAIIAKKNISAYEQKVVELLELTSLSKKRNRTPGELSGGEQQRVAIARAFINDPDIILADEPTGNLDSKTSKEILSLLKRCNQELKKMIVMVTHSSLAASYSERLICFKDGQIGADTVLAQHNTLSIVNTFLEKLES